MVPPGKSGTTSPAFLPLLGSNLPHRGAHGLAARAPAKCLVVGFPAAFGAKFMLSSPVPEAAVGGGNAPEAGIEPANSREDPCPLPVPGAAGPGEGGPDSPGTSFHTGANGRQLLIV